MYQLERCRRVAQAFEASQRALWCSLWPGGHCAVTSLLLAPLLRCADPAGEWRVAIGVVAYTRCGAFKRPAYQRDIDRQPYIHAWCERADGALVDGTYGQFDFGDALAVLEAHEAGDLGHYASVVLDLDAEEAYRRSITPSERDGWGIVAGRTGMYELFQKLDYL